MAGIQISRRILTSDASEIDISGDTVAINLSDTVFEFLSEETEGLLPAVSSVLYEDYDDEEKGNESENEEDNDTFWETQLQLLQAAIIRTSSLESRIRRITKEVVKEVRRGANSVCACGRAFDDGCRKCLMEAVRCRLQEAGLNCAICKSKWRSTPDFPSGEHTFLDVVDNSNPKKAETRVIIELNFRAQFEMARANDEYKKLIEKLPKIFVGKIERLLGLLKILCAGTKMCMKEKRIHMGPWRKHQYMQAKWLRTCERLISSSSSLSAGQMGSFERPRVSMLTADIMDNFSNMLRPTIEVV